MSHRDDDDDDIIYREMRYRDDDDDDNITEGIEMSHRDEIER